MRLLPRRERLGAGERQTGDERHGPHFAHAAETVDEQEHEERDERGEQGGLAAMEARNKEKADFLYGYLDQSSFYGNKVDAACRSRMNVPFQLKNEALDKLFLAESEAAGLLALKGHRIVGGMRASLYNAMPLEGVKALVSFMDEFAKRHG